jgi:hypothetical protein
MTLILSLLTRDFVMQASDQRLTDPTSGALRDDVANKAVLFDSAMTFAYTGPAEIPRIDRNWGRRLRTDDWILYRDHGPCEAARRTGVKRGLFCRFLWCGFGPSLTDTVAPFASTVPGDGDWDLTTSLPLWCFGFLTLPSVQWAAARSFRALPSVFPLSVGTTQ